MGQKAAWQGSFDFQSARRASCIVILLTSIVKARLIAKGKRACSVPVPEGCAFKPGAPRKFTPEKAAFVGEGPAYRTRSRTPRAGALTWASAQGSSRSKSPSPSRSKKARRR
jgi:hypothetical protein